MALRRLTAEPVEPIAKLSELDAPTRAALEKEVGTGLVEPGQPFSAVCTAGPDQAHQRMVLAGRAGTLRFVEYEYGGYAYGVCLLVFERTGDRAKLLCRAYMRKPKRLVALQAALRRGEFTLD